MNLLMAGVGGQGTLHASHLLAKAAIEEGLSAKVGETYGASMRGGPVASHVRIGENIYSPINPKNGADVILALEPMEGLRNALEFLSRGGIFLSNSKPRLPYDVNIGRVEYPDLGRMKEVISKVASKVKIFDASSLAKKAGDIRTMNIVMLGSLCGFVDLPMSKQTLERVILEKIPSETREENRKAFELGFGKHNE